jgi:propionate CoA-transferase
MIVKEGKHVKFKKQIEQITFSSDFANGTGQDITFVTERAVMKLTKEGLKLVEIAPGIDLEKDILAHMEFTPVMDEIKLMDSKFFCEGPIGLREIIQAKAAE